MSSSSPRSNPELLLKLTHLRGAIAELMLRGSSRLQLLRQSAGVEPGLVEELLRYNSELTAHFSELELALEHLRRRGEENELADQEKYGSGKLHIEADTLDVRDLELIASTLRRAYEAFLFAKTPTLPLDKLYSLADFHLSVSPRRLDGAWVLQFRAPLVEESFVPALLEIARAIGVGEKPLSGAKRTVPIGWGPALVQVRRLAAASLARGESFQDRLQESLESINTQFEDQLSPLADAASLGLPAGCLRTIAELLAELLLELKGRGHVQALKLSGSGGELYLIDEVGREPRPQDNRAPRDVLKEKMDRFIRIQRQDS